MSRTILQVVGAALAIFVVHLCLAVRGVVRDPPQALPALAAVAMDGAWVLGTIVLLPFAAPNFTTAGLVIFIGVALVVTALG